jgi:hypothetical protein
MELAYLDGSPYKRELVVRGLNDIYKYYLMVCGELPQFRRFPFQEFLEVWVMVNSRTQNIQIGGKEI